MTGTPWVKKSAEVLRVEAENAPRSLKRALGVFDLTVLGLGALLGAGFFADLALWGVDTVWGAGFLAFIGHTAAQHAGPGVVLSLILAGVGVLMAGLCYAEMAAMFPTAGSAYTYTYAGMGKGIAWLVGWDLILEYLIGAVAVAIGWSGYVGSFLRGLDIEIPPQWAASPFSRITLEDGRTVSGIFNLPAVLIVLAVTAVLLIGIKESANLNTALTGITVGTVMIFLVAGLAYIQSDHWRPWIPANAGAWGQFGWSGIFRGTGAAFLAYMGFDAVSTMAQEAKNPQRDLPIAILGSLLMGGLIYGVSALVLTGILPYTKFHGPDPVATSMDEGTKMIWLVPFFQLGAIAGLSSLITVLLLGQSRVFLAMARDGFLGSAMAKIHPRRQTPYVTLGVTGALVAVGGGLIPIQRINEWPSAGMLCALIAVCASVLRLRQIHPEIQRPFKTPGAPLIPLLGIGACLAAMALLPLYIWRRLIVWMGLGLVIYFVYGQKHGQPSAAGLYTNRLEDERSGHPGRNPMR